ncbi:MAG: tetratricopeptide repeat protein, partial [Pyrinomonadaceae bacterium]
DLDPNNHDARREMALLLISVGRNDQAIAEIDKAIAIAPTSFNKRTRGAILYFSRRYDEAIAQLEQTDETDPEFIRCLSYLMRSYEMKKDWQNAVENYIRLRRRDSTPGEIDAVRASFASGGWPAILTMMINRKDRDLFVKAGTLAELGHRDQAFELLNDMAERRRIMIVQVAREPRLDPLKGDPRYHALLQRIGLR